MLARRLEALLTRHWWQPGLTWLARLLQPLAALHGLLLKRRRARAQPPAAPPVPVVVVGNLTVGGAGKTPVVMALVQALQAAGWHPGVVSRGYGREEGAGAAPTLEVQPDSLPRQVGDEPLLVRRRTGVPVVVARRRVQAVQQLCRLHPQVDVIVSDDGLQHRALGRALEIIVFDERGVGNGLLLPAGPLREPVPHQLTAKMRMLHSGQQPPAWLPSTAVQRHLGPALPLQAWWQGDATQAQPLATLQGRPLLALAGLAAPEKFFAMLQAAGLQIIGFPQPDHARYDTAPWPSGTADVITTEKDAVKLPPALAERTRVWVVGLDLVLPAHWVTGVIAELSSAAPAAHPTPPSPPTPSTPRP